MRGKRRQRTERRERQRARMEDPTDPDACTCGHEGMPFVWHTAPCMHFGVGRA